MSMNIKYWTKVLKNLLYVFFIFLGLFFALKLSMFYMPFLVAFIISLLIEPLIKRIMRKTKLTRRTSSIIIFIVVAIILISSITWIVVTLFSEASNLLENLNNYFDKAYILFQNFMNNFNFNKVKLSNELSTIIQSSAEGIFSSLSNMLKHGLNNVLEIITSLPSMAICFGITIVALYFICVDKIYILDQIEHHFPKTWVNTFIKHLKDLTITLGGYLRAEASLVFVSFVISLIGLYLLKIIGFNIEFPLLMALFIGFVDALPILGSSAVMIPWAIICAINGDWNLGITIIGLLIIMSIIRQILEPKLVSKNIGVHPIFTLIAMYTGFKFIGVFGLLIGPIVLIIFKNIFSSLIEQGFFKTIFEKK